MQISSIFPNVIFDFAIYLIAGLIASYYYYGYRNRALLGGFWGGALIGLLGALLVSLLTGLEAWFIRLVTWLMQPKFDDVLLFRVNLIAAIIGAFLFVYVLNRINHDRERKR